VLVRVLTHIAKCHSVRYLEPFMGLSLREMSWQCMRFTSDVFGDQNAAL